MYGAVSQMSQSIGVSRQTLYAWKANGQRALEAAFAPKQPQAVVTKRVELHRVVLTLLIQAHASYRGIQACLKELLGLEVSLGTITAIVQAAGQRAQGWLQQQVVGQGRSWPWMNSIAANAVRRTSISSMCIADRSGRHCLRWLSMGKAGYWRCGACMNKG